MSDQHDHPCRHLAITSRHAVRPPRFGRFGMRRRLRAAAAAAAAQPGRACNGSAGDVMLQGFHRASHVTPGWYGVLEANAETIRSAGFDIVWLPPASASVDPLGYLPTRWFQLESAYGSGTELAKTMKALAPIKLVADVVVNHRCGVATAEADFDDPPFPVADQREAVCADDESGIGTGAPDSGQGQVAGRDLDHTNVAVRDTVHRYLELLTKTGFAGWRFDQAKGYDGAFTAEYIERSKPYIAVGEYWDYDRQRLMDFVDATGGRSMVFDFATRFMLREAMATSRYGLLKAPSGKATGAIGWWPSMCVTFLENHDTEPSAGRFADSFGKVDRILAGYAYLLTHPGIPCVYWPHFFDMGDEVQARLALLVWIRKEKGIGRDSIVNIVQADDEAYVAAIDAKVILRLGYSAFSPGDGWTMAAEGEGYAVWTRN